MYEGYPHYYDKEEATVRMADGSEIKGMVYIMCDRYKKGSPVKEYYADICKAYKKLGLGSEISTVLEPALMRCRAR